MAKKRNSNVRRKPTRSPQGPSRTPLSYRDPPQLTANPYITQRFRFRVIEPVAGTTTITNPFLSRLLMAQSKVSTDATHMIASFKLRSVEVWLPPGNADFGFIWNGGGLGTDKTLLVNSLSTARPPYLFTVPPKNSIASFWGRGDGTAADYFSFPNLYAGMIVDVVMQWQFPVGEAFASSSIAAGASLGNVIFGRLDGATGSLLAVTGGEPSSSE